MNIWKGVEDVTARFWKSIDKGFRGTMPSRDKIDWKKDSRQVIRAKLRTQSFNEVSKKFDIPRRNRRLSARRMAARIYREAA